MSIYDIVQQIFQKRDDFIRQHKQEPNVIVVNKKDFKILIEDFKELNMQLHPNIEEDEIDNHSGCLLLGIPVLISTNNDEPYVGLLQK